MEKCIKCGGPAEGYKCDVCGAESSAHDEQHACGGEHCMPKCGECNQAQSQCNCMA